MIEIFSALSSAVALAAAGAACMAAVASGGSEEPAEPEDLPAPWEHADLLEAVRYHFAIRRIPVAVEWDDVIVGGPQAAQHYPLRPLAALCRGVERTRWHEIIEVYFARPAARPRRGVLGRPQAQPQPAPTGDDERVFAGLVRAYFRRLGREANVQGDIVTARDAAGREHRYQMDGMGQLAARLDRSAWAGLIAQIFGGVLEGEAQEEQAQVRTFAEAAKSLAIVLVRAADHDAASRVGMIYSEDLPGLLSVLVYRLPEGGQPVPPSDATLWGKRGEEAFAAGLARMREQRLAPERVSWAHGVQGAVLQTKDGFAAGHALLLGDEPVCAGPAGALVGVPRSGAVFCLPLVRVAGGRAALLDAAAGLMLRIYREHARGPEPLAPNLYWYHGGRFGDLPYQARVEDGQAGLVFIPPPELLGALDGLER